MKKSVWIPLLATACVVAGAAAGAYIILKKREKELAEYDQMIIDQDIPVAEWTAEELAAEAAPEAAEENAEPAQAPTE